MNDESKHSDSEFSGGPLLSICIPSFGRAEILRRTLDSIYADLDSVCLRDFEVVVSDNDPSMSLQGLISEYQFSNFHYHHSDCTGFRNSVNALSYGSGKLLKLHNNTMLFNPGTLSELIKIAKRNEDEKPLFFYTNGIRNRFDVMRFDSFDNFMDEVSYYSSWSNGFSIWKEDFSFDPSQEVDEYFPQISILFSQSEKSSYILTDYPYFKMQTVKNKGGYNIFEVFCNNYIGLLESAVTSNIISDRTLKSIKNRLLWSFFPLNYFKTKVLKVESYETSGLKDLLGSKYPWYAYYLVVFFGTIFFPYYVVGYFKKYIYRAKNKLGFY